MTISPRWRGRRPSIGWVVFVAWVAAVQLSGIRYLGELQRIPESPDFKFDFVAATWVAQGKPIEALDRATAEDLGIQLGAERSGGSEGPAHTHPPPATLPVRVLLPLGFRAAATAWFLLSLGALFMLAALLLAIWRRSKRLPPARQVWPLALVLAVWPPSVMGFACGQWSILLAMLIAAGWWELERGAPRRSAVWFASAIAVKTTPALLCGYLALRARRVAVGVGATFAAIVLVSLPLTGGLGAWRAFFKNGSQAIRVFESVAANTISVHGIFMRLFVDSPTVRAPFNYPRLGHLLSTGATIALLCVAAGLTRRRPSARAEAQPEAFAMWACLVALLNPLAWTHNAPLLLLPAVLLARDPVRSRCRMAVAVALIILTVPRQLLYAWAARGVLPVPASRGWILGLHALGGLILFAAACAASREAIAQARPEIRREGLDAGRASMEAA